MTISACLCTYTNLYSSKITVATALAANGEIEAKIIFLHSFTSESWPISKPWKTKESLKDCSLAIFLTVNALSEL